MKLQELYNGISVALTNEENKFLVFHGYSVPLISLNERDEVIAQSLVRKGVYDFSPDRKFLIKPSDAKK